MAFVLGALTSSEFDIQAGLWRALRDAGHNVRGEVRGSVQGIKTGRATGNKVRLDLVVFCDGGKPLLAIEVKPKRGAGWREDYCKSEQFAMYSLLEFPVVMVCGESQAAKFLERMPWALALPPGVHWLE